ncbi:hypothetical protein KCP69_23130 [Salmonella enterica subsp. enterica]|nr:hypothetical protein KCP69_23130 [Salmonella enterica subsp. enterica]
MSLANSYQRSINEPEAFLGRAGPAYRLATAVYADAGSSRPPFARWFCGGTTNWRHNAVDRRLDKQPEALALIAVSSETDGRAHIYLLLSQLHDEVNIVAASAAVAGRSVAIAYWSICR